MGSLRHSSPATHAFTSSLSLPRMILAGFEPIPGHLIAPLILGLVLGALGMLLPLFIALYIFLDRFATKLELKAAESRAQTLHDSQASDMRALEERLSRDIATNREAASEHYGSVSAKIDALNGTVQTFANEINRVVGRLEERADHPSTTT